MNVFLDAPDENRYTRYPKPLLGDFGLALKTKPNDPNNPCWYNKGEGTDGFLAPEHSSWIDAQTWAPIEVRRLDSKTNVYGMGLILWCLIMREQNPPQPLWLGDGNNNTALVLPAAPGQRAHHYSKALGDLVESCVRFRPMNRPSFQTILDIIWHSTDESPGAPNLALNMRTGTASAATAAAQEVPPLHDNYELGLARGQVVNR